MFSKTFCHIVNQSSSIIRMQQERFYTNFGMLTDPHRKREFRFWSNSVSIPTNNTGTLNLTKQISTNS